MRRLSSEEEDSSFLRGFLVVSSNFNTAFSWGVGVVRGELSSSGSSFKETSIGD